MTELLPSEYWEYGLADAAVGMLDALLGRVPDPFIAIPGLGDCIPTRSARSAIMAAIEALELPKEGRIGVPLYCCPAVFKAVVAAGRRLRFVDVDPATCCMSTEDVARKIDDLDAIIGVHMFGNLCDIPGLVMVAGGKPVIEDCAQAIGSLLGGSPAGSFGAVSVFSFRSGKYLSVGEGGAVYAPDEALRSHIAEIVSSPPGPWSGRGMSACSCHLRPLDAPQKAALRAGGPQAMGSIQLAHSICFKDTPSPMPQRMLPTVWRSRGAWRRCRSRLPAEEDARSTTRARCRSSPGCSARKGTGSVPTATCTQ